MRRPAPRGCCICCGGRAVKPALLLTSCTGARHCLRAAGGHYSPDVHYSSPLASNTAARCCSCLPLSLSIAATTSASVPRKHGAGISPSAAARICAFVTSVIPAVCVVKNLGMRYGRNMPETWDADAGLAERAKGSSTLLAGWLPRCALSRAAFSGAERRAASRLPRVLLCSRQRQRLAAAATFFLRGAQNAAGRTALRQGASPFWRRSFALPTLVERHYRR